MGTENRDGQLILRVSDEERITIMDACGDRSTTISQLIRDALQFYLGFPTGFIEQMEKVAKEYKTDVSTMVARLMLVYCATDKTIIDNFHFSATYQRAFRFDAEGKLIDVEKISDITVEEVDAICKSVLKKMKWIASGKQALLTKEEGSYVPVLKEAATLARAAAEGQGVKPEYAPKPVARAKGK